MVMTLFVASGLSFFDRQVLSVLAPVITKDLRMDHVTYSSHGHPPTGLK